MGIDRADLQARVLALELGCRAGHQRADRGSKARQAHAPGAQPDVGGQFRVGGVDAADDLGGSVGQQAAGLGQADAPASPLDERKSSRTALEDLRDSLRRDLEALLNTRPCSTTSDGGSERGRLLQMHPAISR